MSDAAKNLWIGAVAIFVGVLTLIGWLWHERDHDHTDYTLPLFLVGMTIIAVALVGFAMWRNLKDAKRADKMEAQIMTLKDEQQTQLNGLRAEHTRELEAKRLSMFEEIQAKLPVPKQSWALPYHGDDTGLHFEGAMFGAPDITPIDVSAKVRRCIDKGDNSVPVSWQYLLGHDPKEHAYKYLTMTFSVSEMEGKSLFVPTVVPAESAKQQKPDHELSDSEFSMKNAADNQFRGLTVGQRYGLREVYRNPNRFSSDVAASLTQLGFADAHAAIVKPLMATTLIHVDGRNTLSPSPHKVVSDHVEHLMKAIPL